MRQMLLISVAMPTYDPAEEYLREAIESVRGQRYPHWELCIADDGSNRARVRELLDEYALADSRIRVEFLERNCGISAASNRALAVCGGEYVAFLDHDDVLAPDALVEVARALDADPSLDVVYSDQDKLGPRGDRVGPFFKPDWSPVYALGAMYIGHLLVVRRALLERVGGFDPSFDTIQDFELLLRVSEHTDRIHHIPRILYHWRAIPGSIAAGADQKAGVPELQARAVSAHLRRRGIGAGAVPHPEIPHRTRLVREASDGQPLVSVIVPGDGDERDLERCLDSVHERTAYPSFEVIVAGAGRTPPGAVLNRGAAEASGEHLIFLGADTEIVETDWIERLLAPAQIPSVGVVGALCLHPDGRVEHAGLALRRWERAGVRTTAGWWHGRSPAEPVMRGAPGDSDGYFGSLSCAREVGAVAAACMLVSRSLHGRVGGFNEEYRAQHHDADFCLRVRDRGLEVVYAPRPRIVRHDASRPGLHEDMIDRALLVDSWFDRLDRGDPYLSSHLSIDMAPAAGQALGARALARRLVRRR